MFRIHRLTLRGADLSLAEFKGLLLAKLHRRAAVAKAGAPTGATTNASPIDSTVVVDVRSESELLNNGRFPGAVHIPVAELPAVLAEAAAARDPDDIEDERALTLGAPGSSNLVFVCHAGGRSNFAVHAAESAGYGSARHYPGGWCEYAENPIAPAQVAQFVEEATRATKK